MGKPRSYIGHRRPKGIIPVSGCGRRASATPEIPRPVSSQSTRCRIHSEISLRVPRTRFSSSPCWTPRRASLTPAGTLRQVYIIESNTKSKFFFPPKFRIKTCRVELFVEPNTPGKFIVWFRNETTLLVLWQPPYPAGIYTHYKVSIDPPDAIESVLYVEKEGEPPGPAQAAFKGLVPGQLVCYHVITHTEHYRIFTK